MVYPITPLTALEPIPCHQRFLRRRLLVVPPDMHRVHHSIRPHETDASYGFNFPWWDRLLGTYLAQPEDGHETMTLGLAQFQNDSPTRLGWTLRLPFLPGPR